MAVPALMKWPARIESVALARLARDSRVRDAILRLYEVTGRREHRVRRGQLIAAVAAGLGMRSWEAHGRKFALEVRAAVTQLGGGAVTRDGYAEFVGVVVRADAQKVPSVPSVPPPTALQPRIGTPAFERLRRTWYEKSDPLGEDIEDPRNPDGPLSDKGTVRARANDSAGRGRTPEQIAERAAFIREAERFLDGYRFRDARDRAIWADVARGRAIRDISLALRIRKADVVKAVRRLKEEMARWQEES